MCVCVCVCVVQDLTCPVGAGKLDAKTTILSVCVCAERRPGALWEGMRVRMCVCTHVVVKEGDKRPIKLPETQLKVIQHSQI